jgi:exopolysaccharide biosynthesis WecB/TagA/CpsF family protein
LLSRALAPDGAPPPDVRRLGPLTVRAATRSDAAHDILNAVRHRQGLRIAFANTHLLYCAVSEPRFALALRSFYLVNDGVGMTLLARLACGAGFKENLNGTDFTPLLLAHLPEGAEVFLVGARPDVVASAARLTARRWPHLNVCGYRDGFDGSERALDDIAALHPSLVLVAMGNPLQERWIARAAERSPGSVFMGVGALFDFLTGAAPRAPAALRAMRLEWAFRLAQEPQRLWRRYTVEILVILASLARSALRETRP